MNQSTIKERLDSLRKRIQTSDFLEGKGLSNEVNIHIFCYDPSEEMTVRHFVSQLVLDQTLACRVVECDLYRIFIEICADMDILDSIPEIEEADGSTFLLEQLHSAVDDNEFIAKIQPSDNFRIGDVLLLTGVGEVFPFMRVHKILEAMQPYFSNVPILVMYPGEFDGNYLQLFNMLSPNPYYRAFNAL